MAIEDRKVVSFHYSLRNDKGEPLESSREGDPLVYLHGYRNIIPGLEKAMAGKDVGDSFQVTVEPAEAYGERNANSVQRVSAKHFPNPKALKPGQLVRLQTRNGPVQATIVKVGRFNVDVDTNHPLAGHSLRFSGSILEVREASEEEIRHGHVHLCGHGH